MKSQNDAESELESDDDDTHRRAKPAAELVDMGGGEVDNVDADNEDDDAALAEMYGDGGDGVDGEDDDAAGGVDTEPAEENEQENEKLCLLGFWEAARG